MRNVYFLTSFLLLFTCNSTATYGQSANNQDLLKKEYSANLELLDEAILKHRQSNNVPKLAKAYERKADFLYEKKIGISLPYYEKALQLYNKAKNKEEALKILKLLSREYAKIDDRENALKKMYELLTIY